MKVKACLLLVACLVLVTAPLTTPNTATAVPVDDDPVTFWPSACGVAADYGWGNPGWNFLCAMQMMADEFIHI